MRQLLPGEPWFAALPPEKLGLNPEKYPELRSVQAEAIQDALNSEYRFVVLDAPMGVGKSAAAMTIAHIEGVRAAYLTVTRELQRQIMRDKFPGVVLAQGRNNYVCSDPGTLGQYTCEEHSRWCKVKKCSLVNVEGRRFKHECSAADCDGWAGSCAYKQAVQDAVRADRFTANYAFWMAMGRYGNEGLGGVDLLICDEAHHAPEEVCRALATVITHGDLGLVPGVNTPRNPKDVEQWQKWAKEAVAYMALHPVEGLEPGRVPSKDVMKVVARREKLAEKCAVLINMYGDWVAEHDSRQYGWVLEPVWPYQHSENLLFRGAPKVLLMSGTITRKTMGLLGVSAADYEMFKYPYVFPRKNNPMWHVKTAALNKHTKPENIEVWLRTIYNILKSRRDRKGIVHTVSYRRAEEIMEYLERRDPELARMCLTHDSRSTREVVAKYKQSSSPCFLLSPAVTTGYDFPYEQCEFIIVAKMPFPVMTSAKNKARAEKDKHYSGYVMATEFAQATGRGMRHYDDRCEVFVVDDLWFFVSKRYHSFLPSYINVKTVDHIPRAPLTLAKWRELKDQLEPM